MQRYLAALHQISKCTNKRLFTLFKKKRDFEYLWKNASVSDFMKRGIEQNIAEEIVEKRKGIDPDKPLQQLKKDGVKTIHFYDKEYPLLLKEISDPPFLLYVRGDISALNKICFAVVGTRLMTPYGRQSLEHIIPPLIQTGLVVVSGLAIGVDAHAHKVTLNYTGKTIAVLGSGIDCISPSNNTRLAEKIVEQGGAVISEFPVGMKPTIYTFPIRNRIISGLSKGVLIVEAKEKSGSLITAQLALDQNREVFALSGSIFAENMMGTHRLIQKGEAKLVTSGQDILEELGIDQSQMEKFEKNKTIGFDSKKEEQIYTLLTKETQYTDHIIQQSGLSSSEVNGILTVLEMKGFVENLNGMMWIRK